MRLSQATARHNPPHVDNASPSVVSDVMFEMSWTQEPRGLSEILAAEDLPSRVRMSLSADACLGIAHDDAISRLQTESE
jgi:hypothetical protein